MSPISDVVDVLDKVKAMSVADRAMFERGTRAFVSFVQAYAKHECRLIFRIKGKRKQILSYNLLAYMEFILSPMLLSRPGLCLPGSGVRPTSPAQNA